MLRDECHCIFDHSVDIRLLPLYRAKFHIESVKRTLELFCYSAKKVSVINIFICV